MIIGDVRAKGLDAIRSPGTGRARSGEARPRCRPEQVAGEVSRLIRPHLGEEDFATAPLVQLASGGELTVVNCGHHPPLLRTARPAP